jgi:hypothetical protein
MRAAVSVWRLVQAIHARPSTEWLVHTQAKQVLNSRRRAAMLLRGGTFFFYCFTN